MSALHYCILRSALGSFGLVWCEADGDPKIIRILLPAEQACMQDRVRITCGGAVPGSHPAIVELGEQIRSSLDGNAIEFDLDLLALDSCSEFQRRVILAEYAVPRGWVTTYGRIANHLGVSGGARAVGGALARNPFPIVIPCHRAIRSDGTLGGYQGGLAMKRTLLAYEGVAVSDDGRVLTDRIYY